MPIFYVFSAVVRLPNNIIIQNSQVDLLAKSEMLDGITVVFDAEGVTPLGGLGACSPKKFSKIEVAKTCFPSF